MLSATPVGFKTEHSFEDRESESARIIAKYADRIPVIVERDSKASASLELLDKKKYLVPNELTVGQFMFVIRKRLKLPANEAIYLYLPVGGKMPSSSMVMKDIYATCKDDDGFLYMTYAGENVFG